MSGILKMQPVRGDAFGQRTLHRAVGVKPAYGYTIDMLIVMHCAHVQAPSEWPLINHLPKTTQFALTLVSLTGTETFCTLPRQAAWLCLPVSDVGLCISAWCPHLWSCDVGGMNDDIT